MEWRVNSRRRGGGASLVGRAVAAGCGKAEVGVTVSAENDLCHSHYDVLLAYNWL